MGCVTRYSPKPKPKYLHEVTIRYSETGQAWIWEKAERIAGPMGYKSRSPFWAITIIAFDRQEKAAERQDLLRRWRHDEELRESRKWPCPVRVRYEEAALAQYAVIWGLSTGIIRDVVRVYRHERSNCSTMDSRGRSPGKSSGGHAGHRHRQGSRDGRCHAGVGDRPPCQLVLDRLTR